MSVYGCTVARRLVHAREEAAATADGAGQLPFFLVAAGLKPFIPEQLLALAAKPKKACLVVNSR